MKLKTLLCGLAVFISIPVFANTTLYLQTPQLFVGSTELRFHQIESELINTRANTIVLEWEGYGGNVQMGIDFVNAVIDARNQGKFIVFDVQGFAASMHAYSVCYGNAVRMESSALLMFHLRAQGKTVDHSQSSKNQAAIFAQGCVNKGILTTYDVQQIQDGKEVYVDYLGNKAYMADKREAK
jgi:hypothetical protein